MRSSRPASTRSPPALDPDGVSVLPARSLLALPRLCVTSTRGEGRVDPHLAAQSTVETGPRRGPAPGPRRGADDVARAALLLPACGGPSRACRGPHEVARRGALRSRAWTRECLRRTPRRPPRSAVTVHTLRRRGALPFVAFQPGAQHPGSPLRDRTGMAGTVAGGS